MYLITYHLIGSEKHYISHYTDEKLVEIRKEFAKEFYKSNLQSSFNDAAFTELTRMTLKETFHMKLDKIGKFLSASLETTDVLSRETE